MILVKKNYLHFNFALANLFILIIGISGYLIMNKIDILDNLKRKFYSETLIFLTLIFLIISLIIYIVLYVKSIKVFKDIDKAIEIAKYGNYDITKSLIKLDNLGNKINELFYHLNQLNEQKTLKISSLSMLINFLLENVDISLLVVDIQGLITHCSKDFLEKFDADVSNILYNNIKTINKLEFDEVLFELDKTREKVIKEQIEISFNNKKQIGVTILFLPFVNIKNQLSNVICIFEKENIFSMTTKKLLSKF
ncbi:MAG: hypothetical protein A2Y34_03325 [Spirochaetes bacterium GWC1_27_15]|nr:MAG: hypothetical protein A2Z98_01245 [Spirochaetes bacterium GWB1_27_13]OHD20120.1 MAG: hypothetical protein A2Y34_03325 [Spirochaetes bacterium GWC1_27_15]